MKKGTVKITLLFLIMATMQLNAQSFEKGQTDLNLGLGLGNTFVGSGATNVFPPFSAVVDYGITDAISIGGYLGYTGASQTYYNNGHNNFETYSWSFYIVGVRGAYHFAKLINNDKVDLYAGLMLGYDIADYKYTTNNPYLNQGSYTVNSYGGFILPVFAGCRYRFNDHIGIFGELGYGIAFLNIGFNYKF